VPDFVRVTDPDLPALLPYRNQKDAWLRAAHNPRAPHHPDAPNAPADTPPLFMAEGELVVRQLLDSPHPVHSVLATPARAAAMSAHLALLPDTTPVYLAEPELLHTIVGFDLHRGVLAAGLRPPPTPWLTLANDPAVRTLVVLEDLTNHDNVGGIFRSLAALTGPARSAVLLSPQCCDPLYRKALRVSMGWALRVPFATLTPWPAAIDQLASPDARPDANPDANPSGGAWTTLALTPDPEAPDLRALAARLPRPPTRRLALFIGSEGPGLTPQALAACAHRVRIPIDPAVDSLNAGVAAAVALALLA
jgi:tRNA G18 (ribose-2'-O)-methylase SpoU